MRHAVLIVNRAAGGRRPEELVSRLDGVLARSGFRIDAAFTAAPGDATTLARRAAEAGADAVFALGGDGTLREAAQGLIGTGVPLGPLPGGTANVLGLALGLPRDPLACAESICRLAPRRIDVGLVRSLAPRSGEGEAAPDRVFLMMTSAGLDARVLSSLSPEGKRRFGRAHIAAQGLFEWWDYDYPGLEVEVAGEVHRASFAAVSNIAHYGGPFRMAPAAQLDDRLLHLLVFQGTGRLPTLDFVWSLFRGQHVARDDVWVRPLGPGERVVLRGAPSDESATPGRLDAQVDGDPCPDRPPLEVRLAPEALPVLAPPAAPAGSGGAPPGADG